MFENRHFTFFLTLKETYSNIFCAAAFYRRFTRWPKNRCLKYGGDLTADKNPMIDQSVIDY